MPKLYIIDRFREATIQDKPSSTYITREAKERYDLGFSQIYNLTVITDFFTGKSLGLDVSTIIEGKKVEFKLPISIAKAFELFSESNNYTKDGKKIKFDCDFFLSKNVFYSVAKNEEEYNLMVSKDIKEQLKLKRNKPVKTKPLSLTSLVVGKTYKDNLGEHLVYLGKVFVEGSKSKGVFIKESDYNRPDFYYETNKGTLDYVSSKLIFQTTSNVFEEVDSEIKFIHMDYVIEYWNEKVYTDFKAEGTDFFIEELGVMYSKFIETAKETSKLVRYENGKEFNDKYNKATSTLNNIFITKSITNISLNDILKMSDYDLTLVQLLNSYILGVYLNKELLFLESYRAKPHSIKYDRYRREEL